jgi:L-malate glycosyltransferase
MATLMVIVPDRLSDIVRKGEFPPRYYNPGDVFDEVHLVATNDDTVDPSTIRHTVGAARLQVHHLPMLPKLFLRSLGWRPQLLGAWADRAVELARSLRPGLVRCHGAHLNTFAALQIRRRLGIPYVVSLHINPDTDVRGRAVTWRDRLAAQAIRSVERISLLGAERVLPVYRPIVPYLERLGVRRFEVVYNVLDGTNLRPKTDYRLHDPPRILSVGRQFAEKNPENLLLAFCKLPLAQLTLVGDGPYHDRLRELATRSGVADRVKFERSLANDALCRSLVDYDFFAVHSEYWELSKAVIEALLAGLPTVLNRRLGEPVPELVGDHVRQVENSISGYGDAIGSLMADDRSREQLGRRAAAHAWDLWAPAKMEARVAAIYREVMSNTPRAAGHPA